MRFWEIYLSSIKLYDLRAKKYCVINKLNNHVLFSKFKISFKLLKAVFYPNSLVTINQADSVVKKVNHYLKEKSSQNERIHLISGLGKFCGMDKIHYSLFKSHIVWSRIANTMLQSKSTPNTSNIGLGSMAVSLFKNLTNLVTFDIFKVKRKPSEFF